MTQHLTISGKNYYPCATLAKKFSYSSDYISKLARDKKVDATRVGRRWFVSLESVSEFVEMTQAQKEKRSEQLRHERKAERSQFNSSSNDSLLIFDNTTPLHVEQKDEVTFGGQKRLIVAAMVESVAVVACGFFIGVIGFSISSQVVATNSLAGQEAAVSLSSILDWIFNRTEVVVSNTTLENSQQDIKTSVASSVQTAVEPPVPGARAALVMVDMNSSTTVDDIRASFSDEVKVTFDGPDTGMIKPVFRESTSEESYRFLLVPVSVSASNTISYSEN